MSTISTEETQSVRTVAMSLHPLDVLFFRDARPFGAAGRAESGLPHPQTLFGAIRSHLLRLHGCDFTELGEALRAGRSFSEALADVCGSEATWIAQVQTRGPWLARSLPSGDLEPMFAAPPHLHREKANEQKYHLLAPLPAQDRLPGWRSPDAGLSLVPLWLHSSERTERVRGWLTLSGMQRLLQGDAPSAEQVLEENELFGFEFRTGIGVNPETLTAGEGEIYAVRLLRLKSNVCFYAQVDLPASAPAEVFQRQAVFPWGGEGKRVELHLLEHPVAWPKPPAEGNLLVLTTPGLFANGWCPPSWRESDALQAAAVPDPIALSGWDLARSGPKPTRFAAPAGSSYFFKQPVENSPLRLCPNAEDHAAGWGQYLLGTYQFAS